MEVYELYQYIHLDGRVKHWAYSIKTGEIDVRWGPGLRLSHQKIYSASARQMVQATGMAKLRKGYQYVGQCGIDRSGFIVSPPQPVSTSLPVAAKPIPVNAPPPMKSVKPGPAFDLSKIETDRPDFGWF